MKAKQPATKPAGVGENTSAAVDATRSLWDVADDIGRPQPKRRRTKKAKQPTLQEHYPALIAFTYFTRYVTRDLLIRRFPQLFNNVRTANYQLRSLRSLGYIKRVESHYSANFPYVYAVTKKGIKLLREHFGWQIAETREEARNPQILMHELLLSDVQVTLSLAAKCRQDLSIRFFERRYHMRAKRLMYSAYGANYALEPDLGFLLAVQRAGNTHFLQHFLEFDRGSESPKVFRQKLQQYDLWLQSTGRDYLVDLYRRYGVKNPQPNYRLVIVSRRRKGTSDDDRFATLFTQALLTPADTRNRIIITTGDLLKQHEHDTQPMTAAIWWQVRMAQSWREEFDAKWRSVGTGANQKPLYDFVAGKVRTMQQQRLFPLSKP